jgi:hypothetical protein
MYSYDLELDKIDLPTLSKMTFVNNDDVRNNYFRVCSLFCNATQVTHVDSALK